MGSLAKIKLSAEDELSSKEKVQKVADLLQGYVMADIAELQPSERVKLYVQVMKMILPSPTEDDAKVLKGEAQEAEVKKIFKIK